MEKEKSKNIIIILLLVIVIILATLVCLSFYNKTELNNSSDNDSSNVLDGNEVEDNDDKEENNNVESTDCITSNTTDSSYVQKKSISNSQLMDIYANIVSTLDTQSYYSIVDINGDGIYELITKVGTSEADYIYHFYTYDENIRSNAAVAMGSISAGHTVLYKMNDNTLMVLYAQMGSESVTYYYVDNAWIIRNPNNMSSREVADGEEYQSGDQLVNFVSPSDASVLNQYR
jgi:hypothetical protein